LTSLNVVFDLRALFFFLGRGRVLVELHDEQIVLAWASSRAEASAAMGKCLDPNLEVPKTRKSGRLGNASGTCQPWNCKAP